MDLFRSESIISHVLSEGGNTINKGGVMMKVVTVVVILFFGVFSGNAFADSRCASTEMDTLVKHTKNYERTRIVKELSILPGGDQTTIELPKSVDPGSGLFCARILADKEILVDVVDVKKGPDATLLVLKIAEPDIGPIVNGQLVVVVYGLDDKGVLTSPKVVVMESVRVSSYWFAFSMAVMVVLIAYGLVIASKAMETGQWSIDPVYLTAGYFGRASLSQFQIFGFTLLILGLLVYVLLRTSELSDISTDILLLLGISAGGTAGSKITGTMKNRIDGANWAWLINNGWFTDQDKDENQAKDRSRAKWADLLCVGSSFDVYSFQLLTVSGLVAAGLITSDLDKLAEFSIPEGLLPLLGLSNVVYLGGKAVAPNSVTELNAGLKTLREAETAWLAAVTPAVMPKVGTDKMTTAMSTAPAEYQNYISVARKVARGLKAMYVDDTKFKGAQISDDELMPDFP